MRTRQVNALYKLNVQIGFKLLLEWGAELILNHGLNQKLKEQKAKRGQERMMQHIVRYLVEKKLLDNQFHYSLKDIDYLTDDFLIWDFRS